MGAWLLFWSAYLLMGVADVPFHGDEATQLFMGRDYHYQFVHHDPAQVRYSENPTTPTEQHLRLLNGTLPKYAYGWLSASMGYTLETLNNQWDWGADWAYNLASNHMPAPDLLYWARMASTLLLVVGLWGIFTLGYQLGGVSVALVASAYYALNPALLLNGRRAMMEGWMIGFSVVTVLASVWHVRTHTWQSLLALGISSGLAVASKHTAAFAVLGVFLGAGVWHIWAMWRNLAFSLRPLMHLMVAGVLALGVFYALNPAWWHEPLARIQTVLALRTELLVGQTTTFGGYTNLGEQAHGWADHTLMVLPQYYEVSGWQNNISEQITYYESTLWRGISLGGSSLGALVVGILCLVGIVRTWQARKHPVALLLLFWGAITLILTLLLTPLAWQRYYLPAYPIVGLLLAQGVRAMIKS